MSNNWTNKQITSVLAVKYLEEHGEIGEMSNEEIARILETRAARQWQISRHPDGVRITKRITGQEATTCP